MAKKISNMLQFTMPPSWWGEKWRDGLYSGNGKIGANVYGGVADEKILVNDASLFWLGRTNVVPDISMKLREMRKKIENGDFLDAQEVLLKALSSKNFFPQAELPLPLCSLDIRFAMEGNVTNFCRTLDMENGEVSVNYALSGTKISRSLFVSRENNFVVYQITKQGTQPINVNLSIGTVNNIAGAFDGTEVLPEGASSVFDKQCLCFAARNSDDGTDFGIVARVTAPGGVLKSENNQLKVVGANSIFVIAETFCKSGREKEFARLKDKLNAVKDNYDKMLKAHTAIHSKIYNSVSVELSSGEDQTIEELFAEANKGNVPPLLLEKLYKFGRYLFVSASTGSKETVSPTGLWNGSYKPLKASVNFGGEMQVAHLHTFAGNLSQNLENLFEYFEKNLSDYQTNAMRLFGCRGALVPSVAAPNTGRIGSVDPFAVYFTGAGGWVCNLFYKYCQFSQNSKFLKTRLLPFMKEVAAFYEDFFVEKDGVLNSSPSALPIRLGESVNISDRPVVAKNSALDFAIAKDFFSNLIEASKQTSSNKGDLERWIEFAAKIPNPQLSSDGILSEFFNSTTIDYSGISVGTLYPAYFSKEISMFSGADAIELYEKTADKKLSNSLNQNGFNMAVLANVFSRLKNAYKAKLCVSNIVRGCLMSNLVAVDKDWRGMGICGSGVWTPVQLQTNFALTNAIQEMLLFSKDDTIFVLPAVPNDWTNISFEGLLCENGVVVSCEADAARSTLNVTLLTKKNTKVNLYLPSAVKKLLKSSNKELTKLTSSTAIESSLCGIKLDANKALNLTFKFAI